MATIITPANVTIDPAADGALVAAAFTSHECAYCLSPIVSEQRWYGRRSTNRPLATVRAIVATTLIFSPTKN
jgi:hypothetical protein